ncbi:helix-turn-helix transcriptional regulator [Ancylobacter vacuolatus]|uniref:Uncharacterized protein n=1 Tax=Ancylobacter vacuolatus TaxID=223389 RepID=A0ABU0DN01_9HYPH|nr:hypothetical protein [Ancylobacter vacuolatus]MDQ0349815.1 hypothetical protein [Ancylobacter vacuolatus]
MIEYQGLGGFSDADASSNLHEIGRQNKSKRADPPVGGVSEVLDRFGITQSELNKGLIRVAGIVAPKGLLPIGRSTWHDWVNKGKVAAGIKLSPGVTVWPRAYVANLVLTLHQGGE